MIRWLRSLFGPYEPTRKTAYVGHVPPRPLPPPAPDRLTGRTATQRAPVTRCAGHYSPSGEASRNLDPIAPDLTSVNLYEVPPAAKPEIIVTGTLTAYFDDPKLYEEFKAGEKALQAAIKEVLLSPWFPGSHRPWGPGWYERMDGDIRRDYWTGSTWTLATRFTSHNVCQDLPWRGLAADPRGREGAA